VIVEFRGVKPDQGGTPDDSKLTGFYDFGPSDKIFDWMADRPSDGPTGLFAWDGGRLFCLGVHTALKPCNHSITWVYVDVSM
jgi:hypothetical protein